MLRSRSCAASTSKTMSGNGILQPSAAERELIASAFWRGFEIKGRPATWLDLNDSERESLLAKYHQSKQAEHEADLQIAQQAEQRISAAAQHADGGEPKRLQFKSLSDL